MNVQKSKGKFWNGYVTVALNKKVKALLDELREYPKQSYNDIIKNLIGGKNKRREKKLERKPIRHAYLNPEE